MDRGHAERFGAGILEMIKASESVASEARGCGVDKVGVDQGHAERFGVGVLEIIEGSESRK